MRFSDWSSDVCSSDLDGRLSGVPDSASYPTLDKGRAGLAPVEAERWRGFWFVRLADDGGPSVARMMAPYEAMIAPYRFEEIVPRGRGPLRPRDVNWKNVGDKKTDSATCRERGEQKG